MIKSVNQKKNTHCKKKPQSTKRFVKFTNLINIRPHARVIHTLGVKTFVFKEKNMIKTVIQNFRREQGINNG